MTAKKTRPHPPAPTPGRDEVHVQRDHQAEPRLPHDRDQSADAGAASTPQQRDVATQAAQDVRRGLVDTDRGPVLQDTARRMDATPPPASPPQPITPRR